MTVSPQAIILLAQAAGRTCSVGPGDDPVVRHGTREPLGPAEPDQDPYLPRARRGVNGYAYSNLIL
jgi:hypothetical protein